MMPGEGTFANAWPDQRRSAGFLRKGGEHSLRGVNVETEQLRVVVRNVLDPTLQVAEGRRGCRQHEATLGGCVAQQQPFSTPARGTVRTLAQPKELRSAAAGHRATPVTEEATHGPTKTAATIAPIPSMPRVPSIKISTPTANTLSRTSSHAT